MRKNQYVGCRLNDGIAVAAGVVLIVPFRNNDGFFTPFNYDTDMIMLPVFKYAIIKDYVARFCFKLFFSFMILDPGISHSKFFPCDTTCKMTGFAFVRMYRDFETRFHAAIIHKCRAPESVCFFKSPLRKRLNDRFEI